jgi:hypothetical protein
MIVFAPTVLGYSGARQLSDSVGGVIVVEHHNHRPRLWNDPLRLLPPGRLPVKVAHGAGIPLGEPLIEAIRVSARARVGNAASQKA